MFVLFCVSRLNNTSYKENFDYYDRISYARDNGTNTLILNRTDEPLQNKPFLEQLFNLNKKLQPPFRNIELQTTGVFLTYENLAWLKLNGIKTISLSVSDIFSDANNMKIIGVKKNIFRDHFFDATIYLWSVFAVIYHYIKTDKIFTG